MTAKSVPMQYEDKFYSLARAVEVTEDEMQIAKFFWYAGLRHAFQRGTSSPALLEKAPVVPTAKSDVIQRGACELTKAWAKHFSAPVSKSPTPPVQLTPYEAKLLQLTLAGILSEYQDAIKGIDTYADFLWKNCDPSNKSTEETFREMNRIKDTQRKARKQLQVLNSAQRKLKKLSKGT